MSSVGFLRLVGITSDLMRRRKIHPIAARGETSSCKEKVRTARRNWALETAGRASKEQLPALERPVAAPRILSLRREVAPQSLS